MENLIVWLTRAVIFGSVIMYGAIGETLTEKAGNLNLGTPGIMCIGAAFGFSGAYLYQNSTEDPSAVLIIVIGLVCAFAASFLAGALYSLLTTTLRVNQNITGLTLTIFGVGLSKFVGTFIIPEGSTSTKADFANEVFSFKIFGALSKGFGQVFFSYGFMMYLVILIAIAATLFLNKIGRAHV